MSHSCLVPLGQNILFGFFEHATLFPLLFCQQVSNCTLRRSFPHEVVHGWSFQWFYLTDHILSMVLCDRPHPFNGSMWQTTSFPWFYVKDHTLSMVLCDRPHPFSGSMWQTTAFPWFYVTDHILSMVLCERPQPFNGSMWKTTSFQWFYVTDHILNRLLNLEDFLLICNCHRSSCPMVIRCVPIPKTKVFYPSVHCGQ